MLPIEKVDHVGIRISDKETSVKFYEKLGFEFLGDAGFEEGHPIFMQHASGVVLNLLGPATASKGHNILMDEASKHPGITHVAYKVKSIAEAKAFLSSKDIPLTGEFDHKGFHAIFIRDPDRNVIELDAYVGEEPQTRSGEDQEAHP